jgi:AcrR family transcriptional regulator
MTVQKSAVLDAASRALLVSPGASLGEVAAAAGVSRTTLHSRYATRQDLLVALAHDAMDQVGQAYGAARLTEGPVRDALRRVVVETLPLGPRIAFLLRERSLDGEPEVTARYEVVDQPLVDLVERGRSSGELRADLPTWWLVASILGTVFAAWEAIADGRLAPRDAPDLVLTSMLDGVAAR